MPNIKKDECERALKINFMIYPKQNDMLKDIQKTTGKSKSSIVRQAIETAHKQID